MPEKLPEMTHADWLAEGERRFGPDKLAWAFECPACHHVATTRDYKEAGAPEGAVGYNCVGRYGGVAKRRAFGGEGPGPCDYAGGGLFPLNPQPVRVDADVYHVFAFGDPPAEPSLAVKACEFKLLPPAPGHCQQCGRMHEAEMPHDGQQIFYQMRFQMQHGRAPTWADAVAHCTGWMARCWKNERGPNWTEPPPGVKVIAEEPYYEPKGLVGAKGG